MLAEITNYNDAVPSPTQSQDSFLPSGKAISFQGAARCLWEFTRSSKFLQGIKAAIRAAQLRFPGERIRLLEAGCGPFALLALPLAARFSPAELSFVLLDIHPHSLEAVQKIVQALELEAYVEDYIQTDAATWQCPDELRPHIIVSETMQNGLKNEPQVMITDNLAPQIRAQGFFLPESVTLDLAWISYVPDEQGVPLPQIRRIAPLYELNPYHLQAPTSGTVRIPDGLPTQGQAMIATHIQIFGDIALHDFECSLTLPQRYKPIAQARSGDTVGYCYQRGEKPGLQLTLSCHLRNDS